MSDAGERTRTPCICTVSTERGLVCGRLESRRVNQSDIIFVYAFVYREKKSTALVV